MKKIIITLICLTIALSIQAQSGQEALAKGDKAFRNGQYKMALKLYFAAEAIEPAKKEVVKKRINTMFDKIDKLRKDAVAAQKKAEQLAFALMPNEAKTDPFGYFWKKGKQSLAEFNYPQAYTQLLMANNADNLPTAKRDSVKTIFAQAEWYNKKYQQATGYFYSNQYPNAKKIFMEIYNKNKNDSLTWFFAKASSDFKTEDMVLVEGGIFEMTEVDFDGEKEGNTMKVTLSNFYIAKYEVTNAQYARFLNEYAAKYKNQTEYTDSIQKKIINISGVHSNEMKSGIYFENELYKVYFGYENRPLAWVSWYGADTFCRFYGLQLPSEAQWEFAARGGNKSQGYEYAGSNTIDEVAEYDENNDKRTKAVGGKKPNELGIYDMSGNLWEWCFDWYKSYPKGDFTDYVNREKASCRVNRGGSWNNNANKCRVAFRRYYYPRARSRDLGFRAGLAY